DRPARNHRHAGRRRGTQIVNLHGGRFCRAGLCVRPRAARPAARSLLDDAEAQKRRGHADLKRRDSVTVPRAVVLPLGGLSLCPVPSLGAVVSALRQVRGVARAAGLATLLLAQIAPVHAENACRMATIGSATVRAATADGVALEDGRMVRLAGI